MRSWLGTALLALVLAAAGEARADTDLENHLRDELRTATVGLREAQDQNAALTAKQKELTAQLAAAQAELDQLKAKAPSAAQQDQLASAEAAAKQSQDQVEQSRAMLDKWQTAYKQAADVARSRDAAARDFEVRFNRANSGLDQCVDKNGKLGKLAEELLDRMGNRSFWDDLGEDEPVTQIYRVKLENILQDYEDKVRDQKATK
ncbi:MAG TPA: hypothetical protein VKS60_14025 [Stellaceae bacterium]|nr:hypothetical protein [Stellaceae bacterium]